METVTLTLTLQQFHVVSRGLMHVPYGDAAPVIDAINAQCAAARETKSASATDQAEQKNG